MKIQLQILILFLSVIQFNSYGQVMSGIYMNASDYKNNRLAYEKVCTSKKHTGNIRLHDFFGHTPYITVTGNGVKHKLKKSELYGFRNCKSEAYRFYNNAVYHIADAGNIYIYTQTQNIAQSKGFKVVNKYYFSTSQDSRILSLTIKNLKNEYHGSDKFIDLLDQFFTENNINEYDNNHKTFKVNYVFSKSVKQ